MATKKATKKTATPKAQLMRESRARKHQAGLVKVEVWVPVYDVDRVRRYAARIVKEEEYRVKQSQK